MHTTGINWQSLGVIAALIGIAVTILLFMIARKDKKHDQEARDLKEQIGVAIDTNSSAITALGQLLEAKLETKEAVNQIRVEMAELRAEVRHARHMG